MVTMIPRKQVAHSMVVLALCLFLQACGGAGGPATEGGGSVSTPGTTAGIKMIELVWDPPAANSDGTPLMDLARYRIYIAQESPLSKESAASITVENVTTYTFTGFNPGTYYFAVSAVNFDGVESELSNEVEKILL